ncbi:MAG: saccharopine dehydrogenase, partial [Gammaproteobacteria bacterium]
MNQANPASDRPLLWLRDEEKPHEARSLLTPDTARALLAAGYPVVVEESDTRVFPIQAFRDAGCRIEAAGAWRRDAPPDAIILGLKELAPERGPFSRRHVHFAHVFKDQAGWQDTLGAFRHDGGVLYDLEYLVDDDGRRVAAFGYWAGFVGATLGFIAWCAQQDVAAAVDVLGRLEPWPSSEALLADTGRMRDAAASTAAGGAADGAHSPRALVIGAGGRSGRGAVSLFEALEIPVTEWDIAETQAGGPFDALLEHDIVVNCVFVAASLPPFTTLEHLGSATRRTAVISDVSCDPDGDYNPLPIYTQATTMTAPTQRLLDGGQNGSPPLDLVAIDHL